MRSSATLLCAYILLGTAGVSAQNVDLYTGQHSESFPLASIGDPNGIGADLTLHYNGNVSELARKENHISQASPFGLGFTMSEQQIICSHFGTADINDDTYGLIIDGYYRPLVHLADSAFITETGDPWKVYRHVESIEGVPPMVTGWTIIKEDGLIYRYGDFNIDCFTQYSSPCDSAHATRSLLRYGSFVIDGTTQTAIAYPVAWDLKMIHNRDTAQWVSFEYAQELDRLLVLTDEGNFTAYTNPYTRTSHLSRIILYDGRTIDISYDDRDDVYAYYDNSMYQHYAQKKINCVTVCGPNGDSLTTIKLTFGYLNVDRGSLFKKLILKGIMVLDHDESDTLSSMSIQYFMDTSAVSFGSIRSIIYPTGAVKEYHYSEIADAENLSSLDRDIYSGITIDSVFSSYYDMYYGDNMYYAEVGDSVRIGIWDGYWHEDTISVSNGYMPDIPGLSSDRWMAYFDRSVGIIVKRWMDGYWQTDTLGDVIRCEYTDSVRVITGTDCFIAYSMNKAIFGNDTIETIGRCRYYNWDGRSWSFYTIFGCPGSAQRLVAIDLYGKSFGIIRCNSVHEMDICWGFYDDTQGALEQEAVNLGSVIEDPPLVVGNEYIGYYLGSDEALYYCRWNGSSWDLGEFDGISAAAIAWQPNGIFVKGMFLSSGAYDIAMDGSKTRLYTGGYYALDSADLQNSGHSVAIRSEQGASYHNGMEFMEWSDGQWEPIVSLLAGSQRILESYMLSSWLFSYNELDTITNCYKWHWGEYLGDNTWSMNNEPLDSYIRPGTSPGYVVSVNSAGTHVNIRQFDKFRYSEGFKSNHVCNYADTSHVRSLLATSGQSFFAQLSDSVANNSLHAYHIVGERFKGKARLVAVDSVYSYAYASDNNPRIQSIEYAAGMLDKSGQSPRFTRAVISAPYFKEDAPVGYSVTYFYNDIGDTAIVDGHIDNTVLLPDLGGISGSEYIYGVPNGGFRLDGRPYLTYSYSTGGGTTESVDYAYYYYKLHETPYTSLAPDVMRIRPFSMVSRTDDMVNTSIYLHNPVNGLPERMQTVLHDGDSLITHTSYAFEDATNPQKADSIEVDNAIGLVLDKSDYRYYATGDSTVLVQKKGYRYEYHATWVPVEWFAWRDVDIISDTLRTLNIFAFDSIGNSFGSIGENGDTTWIKYDKELQHSVAIGSGCSYEEFLVQDFEQGSGSNSWDGWVNTTDAFIQDDNQLAFTGDYSKKFIDNPTTSVNPGPSRTIAKGNLSDSLYYFTYWVRGNWPVRIWCLCEDANNNIITNGEKYCQFDDLDDNEWQKVEGIFNLNDISWPSLDHIIVQLSMNDDPTGNAHANFDNFRFQPLRAMVTSTVYDQATGLTNASLDMNNIPVRYSYDCFSRPTEVRNHKGDILKQIGYHTTVATVPQTEVNTAISSPVIGIDSVMSVVTIGQYINYELLMACSLTTTGGSAAIYSNGQLTASLTCADVCTTMVKAGHFWASLGDTIIIVVQKYAETSGSWDIDAKAWIDRTLYSPNDPGYAKTISYNATGIFIHTIEYYDSFGDTLESRSTQFIVNGSDTTEAALVSNVKEYDALGRAVKIYKPYYDIVGDAEVDNYTPRESILTEATAYYCDTCDINSGGRPYFEKAYYDDVKGRLQELAVPGNPTIWGLGSGHSTSYSFSSDTINGLYKDVVIDPDGVRKVTVTDRWGRFTEDSAYYTVKNSLGADSTAFRVSKTYMNIIGVVDSIVAGDGVTSAKIRAYWYNDLRQLTKEWRVDYDTVIFVYDKAGNLRFKRDAKLRAGNSFAYFKYDKYGRQIEDGLVLDTMYFTQTWADQVSFPNETVPGASLESIQYTWVYDHDFDVDSTVEFGVLKKTGTPTDSYYREYHYSPFGDADTVTVKLLTTNGLQKHIVHDYDPLNGKLTRSTVFPRGWDSTAARVSMYLYDQSGRLEYIREGSIDGEPIYQRDFATYKYLPEGLLDSTLLGHYLNQSTEYYSQVLDYDYNVRGLLTNINDTADVPANWTIGGASNPHFALSINYDDATGGYYNGRPKKQTTVNSGTSSLIIHPYTYTYNELGWLTKAKHTTYAHSWDEEFSYNYLGNRDWVKSGVAGAKTIYYYDATAGSSRLLGFVNGTTHRFYDAVGNMIGDAATDIDSMAYDYRNLMSYAKLNQTYPNAQYNTMDFAYDQDGQRIRKRTTYYYREWVGPGGGIESIPGGGEIASEAGEELDGSGGGGEWAYYTSNSETHYLYDGSALVAVFDARDSVQQLYINGHGGPVTVYDDNRTTKTYYLLKDQVGSTRVVVDSIGAVKQYINYKPFGGVAEAVSSYNEPLKFAGMEKDEFYPFGYSYFGARYYEPSTGRFTSVDRMGQYASGYMYCGNEPIFHIDPDGNEVPVTWWELMLAEIARVESEIGQKELMQWEAEHPSMLSDYYYEACALTEARERLWEYECKAEFARKETEKKFQEAFDNMVNKTKEKNDANGTQREGSFVAYLDNAGAVQFTEPRVSEIDNDCTNELGQAIDFVKAQGGEVLGVFHTHSETGMPSDADIFAFATTQYGDFFCTYGMGSGSSSIMTFTNKAGAKAYASGYTEKGLFNSFKPEETISNTYLDKINKHRNPYYRRESFYDIVESRAFITDILRYLESDIGITLKFTKN